MHPDRFECPDALLHHDDRDGEYGIIIHDGGSSVITIHYCPWCGSKLPKQQNKRPRAPRETRGLT